MRHLMQSAWKTYARPELHVGGSIKGIRLKLWNRDKECRSVCLSISVYIASYDRSGLDIPGVAAFP